ncbi:MULTISPECIES: BlaI/MecI/CopY family transcriptional regulator [Clostridium]|jgi:BlaI family penicillinase repressor|uniref:BlaI family penicillinase repressor n=2 Tax=Clostridium beijerinckii TaxID=1520 RepID=A0A1S8QCU2_CLOBE|nr:MULTISPECIES: BlaI/MecI/CopY family transcriptional regulator [Clostridium]ABR33155.1 transcriptional repressor, CopY family [Clostridium beijerinckii NCIMB 8052]AIU02975.1 CopY family transcriptional regulator [Clostridium beijerinckii ATCC 35702]MBF7807165.1 BlaI/MecI/CopY family transcriptional regulator [Clostridium beijerinckii]NMF03529.1 BlaI/MecI/CopY family transcriptional regulator [Clostridium beijerinckii]NOW93032.1 BlaI family penicillinase repressor [Clostridium beijerinckii]
MKIFPKISESEWEVMKLIWKTNPLTSEQIINSLSDKMNWSTQTIKTFITRLIKKGAIGFEKSGRIYNYYPLISENECIKSENETFLKKVYDGALGILFTKFLEEKNLSNDEIEELENLLKNKKEKNSNKDK